MSLTHLILYPLNVIIYLSSCGLWTFSFGVALPLGSQYYDDSGTPAGAKSSQKVTRSSSVLSRYSPHLLLPDLAIVQQSRVVQYGLAVEDYFDGRLKLSPYSRLVCCR